MPLWNGCLRCHSWSQALASELFWLAQVLRGFPIRRRQHSQSARGRDVATETDSRASASWHYLLSCRAKLKNIVYTCRLKISVLSLSFEATLVRFQHPPSNQTAIFKVSNDDHEGETNDEFSTLFLLGLSLAFDIVDHSPQEIVSSLDFQDNTFPRTLP